MNVSYPHLKSRADYTVHVDSTIETADNEDHMYHGIMFDLEVKDDIPIESLIVRSLWVRGALGLVNIYLREGKHENKYSEAEGWSKIYSKEHKGSFDFVECSLSNQVHLSPGKIYAIYIHSPSTPESIVYDDERNPITFENCFIKIYSGLACTTQIPFGPELEVMDWHWPWRPNREFVGKLSFGIRYKLWRPLNEVHKSFRPSFQAGILETVKCLRTGRLGFKLYNDVLFLILNMLRFDWFEKENNDLLCLEDKRRIEGVRIGWGQENWTLYRQKILNHRYMFLKEKGILTTAQEQQNEVYESDFDDDSSYHDTDDNEEYDYEMSD